MDLKQVAVEKYESRESLIREGVWKGELYKTADVNGKNRGWLWKTLVIDDDQELKSLLDVPDLKEEYKASEGDAARTIYKSRVKGIRRLTPVTSSAHPLSQKQITDMRSTNYEDEDETDKTSLYEKLEIIDLDLSRLMVDDIFRNPIVHTKMKKIMYNFLIRNGVSKPSAYKQGYHEILGMIFLQLYQDRRSNDTNYNDEDDDKLMMNQVLCIFEKIMSQMEVWSYNETHLLEWDKEVFQPILKTSCPQLYNLIYSDEQHTNIIWLIRWTRLLFIRELPRDYALVIWDHILTFMYPLDTLVACVIVTLLINNYQNLMERVEDHNDLVEFMLHYSVNASSMIDSVELCKMSGNLCELWYTQDTSSMKLVTDSFLKIRFNVDVEPIETTNQIDPNRKRLEERLRKRVKQTLLTREAK